MTEETKELNEYIEEYKKLPLNEKEAIVISELKEILGVAQLMCSNNDINVESVLNREILDVEKENSTTDDYFEAILVYLKDIENHLGYFGNWFIDSKNQPLE